MNVVRCSFTYGAPSIRMEKHRKLVHATDLDDARGLNMLARPTSSPPQLSTSVEAPTMAIAVPMAVREYLYDPTHLSMLLWPFTTWGQQGAW